MSATNDQISRLNDAAGLRRNIDSSLDTVAQALSQMYDVRDATEADAEAPDEDATRIQELIDDAEGQVATVLGQCGG
mgnify:CR=1 FL=1